MSKLKLTFLLFSRLAVTKGTGFWCAITPEERTHVPDTARE